MGWGLVLGINDTSLFCGPLCSLPGHIFRFFVSCTGPEEIVPVGTRGKRRKKNNNGKKKKNRQKNKKKSGNLMKRAQKNFERDPTKKVFWSSETLRERKQKITNKVRDLINSTGILQYGTYRYVDKCSHRSKGQHCS